MSDMRFASVLLASLLAMAACDGCGSGRVDVTQDFGSVEVGRRVAVDGVLSLRGSTPFATLVLETETGEVIVVDSDDDALMTELHGLIGMHCSIDGQVVEPTTPGTMHVLATAYQLMPLPTGKMPIVGVLSLEGGECVLVTKEGKRYWIRGDLAGAIREYVGSRVWVVGERADTDAPGRPKKSTPFTPTGYGVLDEAPAP